MKLIQITPLPSDADAADLAAVFLISPPGSAFSLSLGDGRLATIVLVRADAGRPQRVRDAYTCLFARITQRCLAGLSIHAVCLELAYAGEIPGHGTPENKARELGRAYRAAHCKLKATAFSDKIIQNTEPAKNAILLSIQEKTGMEAHNRPALAPDKLILTSRRPPKHWLINLDTEGLSDATREDILAPTFWREAHGAIQQGDLVSLTSAIGQNVEIIIGPECAEGGFHVGILAERAPALPSEVA